MSYVPVYLDIVKAAINNSLQIVKVTNGVTIEYYHPIVSRNVFSTHDAAVEYGQTPTIVRQNEVVSSIWNKRFSGDEFLDAYNSAEPKIFTESDFRVPINTKVKIVFAQDRYLLFRVNLINTVNNPYTIDAPNLVGSMINIYMLVPFEDSTDYILVEPDDEEPEGDGEGDEDPIPDDEGGETP